MRRRGQGGRQYPPLVLVPAVNEVVPTRVRRGSRYNSLGRARAGKLERSWDQQPGRAVAAELPVRPCAQRARPSNSTFWGFVRLTGV